MQISKFLLTREKIRALSSAETMDEIKALLSACGYNTEFHTDDEIIETERAKTIKTAIDLSTDEAVTKCLEILNKRHEIRKNISAKANLTSFELDILCELELYRNLSEFIGKIKNKNIRNYFVASADFTNVKTFAKYKLAGTKPSAAFVDGGIIEISQFNSAFSGDSEAHKNIFSSTPYHKVCTALIKSLEEKDLNILETAIARQLDEIVAKDKDDIFQPNLFFWWFVKKQTEFIVVKKIMMNKRLKLPASASQESLRGLYERFN
jgi:vacuolar-type H+-ATPase subunit C/Vma6